ncbi:MAG: hypothetical protein N4A63_13480 [Vallitalea sp.]|jgi:hypothetical protein|nr:hypothetical protein [Vallitalea sp.]
MEYSECKNINLQSPLDITKNFIINFINVINNRFNLIGSFVVEIRTSSKQYYKYKSVDDLIENLPHNIKIKDSKFYFFIFENKDDVLRCDKLICIRFEDNINIDVTHNNQVLAQNYLHEVFSLTNDYINNTDMPTNENTENDKSGKSQVFFTSSKEERKHQSKSNRLNIIITLTCSIISAVLGAILTKIFGN